MLELRNIVKDYVSGNNVTHALKGISVNFRKNEFVSILGASGCGKTTTLNIIGGLDRYTSGDLIINGTSTKNYTDRDWDTYRNHSIGFIFQTYNLIGHQNILKNVELALTISGVGKAERRARAMDALRKVGLEGMERKKPNQLSGGQCQRVAIARALINNPEILLADEPTGALDSETSVQIMDLLKEVASDRLVIMVTHNPELAEKYSTRIIRMSDGLLTDDSMPFDGVETTPIEVEEVNKGKKKQSSMSLVTSAGLSLANLRSKLKRTVLVTIAGSIGIIGVSAVLAVSRGVKDFIGEMQNDMLSAYPVQIAEQSVDMTSLMNGLNAQDAKEHFVFDPEDPKVGVDSMINYLMTAYSDITKVKTNTIDKKLVSYIDAIPQESVAVTTKNYAIDPTNNIFGAWVDDSMQTEEEKEAGNTDHVYTRNMSFNGLTQRYIAELKTVEEFAAYASYVDLFTNFMKEMPNKKEYIESQYDIIAGDLSMNKDDLVLVVDKNTTLTDLVLAQTGIFNHDEFLNIAHCAIDENEYKKGEDYNKDSPEERKRRLDEIRAKYPYRKDFRYEDLLNREFTYFPENEIYNDYGYIDTTDTVYSIAFPVLDDEFNIVRFVYLSSQKIMGIDVLYGVTMFKDEFGVWNSDQVAGINTDDFLNPHEKKPGKASIDGKWAILNVNDLMQAAQISNFMEKIQFITEHRKFSVSLDYDGGNYSYQEGFDDEVGIVPDYSEQTTNVYGYSYDAEADKSWIENPSEHGGRKMKIAGILKLKDDKRFGCLDRGLYYSTDFANAYMEDAKEAKVTSALKDHISDELTRSTEFTAYVEFDYFSDKDKDMHHGYASSLNGDLSSSFSDLFSGITGVNHQETNALHLRSLSGLKTIIDKTDDGETVSFDKLPKKISIYPKSFEDKDVITKHLDKWNEDGQITVKVDGADVVLEKNQRDELSYTDTIQVIVKVITTLIDAITISLVVFTSLSLVVSCFMIAVITYISVVERIKEIGVIRSLGGRKRDVASLFTMENLLTGLFSGVFGIAITYLLQLILNIVLKSMFQITIANLTIPTALIMIGVSILLSVVSGFIPSQSAAHKDPVIALRSAD